MLETKGLLWTLPLQSKLEPEQCRPRKHKRCERGQTQCGHALWVLPTHVSDVCLQSSSLPPGQLNKWAQISDHLRPLVSGCKWDTEETCKQRKPKQTKKRELLWKWWVWQIKTLSLTLTKHWKEPIWEQVQAGTRSYLKLNWPHTAQNSSREIPRYIFTIISF